VADFPNLSSAAAELSEQVLELVDNGLTTPIILIDGRAGSGKSTLAALLQNQLFKAGDSLPRLIHMDDLYEGWDGLQAGVDYLQRLILNPVVARKQASWQEFDWSAGERVRWREFEGQTPLIVEGCGSISRLAAQAAQIKIWVECDEQIRYQRWLEREGSEENFGRWAAQEVEFYSRERSTELADVTVAN
jgi:uridine kinase